MKGADVMKTKKQRFISGLLVVVFVLNLLDGRIFRYCWEQLKAYAAASDYSVGFYWETKGLGESNDKDRSYSLSNGDTVLTLTEMENEDPVLRSTFFFNLARAIEPGKLTFTITGLDKLIRNGTLTMNMNDPNLVGTWEIKKDKVTDTYTFVNKVRVTSNNETTFTWQFNSREAINGSDIELKTEVKVTETITTQEPDPETGEIKTVKRDGETIKLDTNPLVFKYHSIYDDSEVKIICKDINDTDFNNLNADYDWRSYYSMLGLKGLSELTQPLSKGGVKFGLVKADFKTDTNTDAEAETAYQNYLETLAKHIGYTDREKFLEQYPNYPNDVDWNDIKLWNAHAVTQNSATQEESLKSRGIKTADYFIEVNPGEFSRDDIMVVDASGSRVELAEYVVNGITRYGFYDFRGGGNRLSGQSYTSEYRVGVKNDAIQSSDKSVTLTGHYLVTYNDEQNVVEYSDTAAHKLSKEDKQPVGDGDYIYKYNDYEINNGTTYSHHQYDSHAKHYSGTHQLLYDNIFNGKVVTYNLTSQTSRVETTNQGKVEAVEYDLIYEDGAPSITNLRGDTPTRVLAYNEYDFQKVLVKKLVDGNTVGVVKDTLSNGTIVYEEEKGFDYDVYGISSDPDATENKTWEILGSGNTQKDSSVYLPAGIDEIKLVVKDLTIRANVTAYVDIAYTVNKDDYENIYIDTEHLYEDNNTVNGAVMESTNKGTKLVNTFYRKRYVGDYSILQKDTYTYDPNDSAYSNTWLRDSVTEIDASAAIEPFTYHAVTGVGASNYYSTTITAGGKIHSDTQKALKKFAVYSKVPDYVSPSKEWITEFRDSLTFSGTLLGSSETIDENFVLSNNALSVYFDEESHCIIANFDFEGLSLDSSAETSVQFSYPAEITLMQFKALELPSKEFETDTFVTVLDEDVRVTAYQNKSFVSADDPLNPTHNDAVKDAKSKPISALGSQKSNYTEKYVSSYYTNWVYDNSAEVDGNNAEHLDTKTGRMTSDYSYKLIFHRFSTDASENVTEPILVDVVDGLQTSSWHGYVKSVTFDGEKSYLEYEPEVYYLLRDSTGVTSSAEEKYKYAYSNVNTAISQLSKYGQKGTGEEGEEETITSGKDYTTDLNVYNGLKTNIAENWIPATKVNTDSFTINQENVYAIAIIYKGNHIIGDTKEMELTAYVNMRAPALSNDGDEANNNRATYNDVHAFAQGNNSVVNTNFPIYSISDQTMVILRHNVELMKVSSTNPDKRLSGAKFTVYKGNTNGTVDADENIVKYYEKGTSEATDMKDMKVDMTGTLQLNLAPGIYYYKETAAPSGYKLDSRLYQFRAISDENSVYYYSINLKTGDELNQEYLIVNKTTEYDAYANTVYNGKTPVADADVFHIYSNNTDKTRSQVSCLVYDDELGCYTYNQTAGNAGDVNVTCRSGFIKIKALKAGSYFIGKNENDPDGYSFSVADNSEISFMILKKSVVTDVKYYLKEMLGSKASANDPLCTFTSSGNGTYSYNSAGTVREIVPDADGKISITGLTDNTKYYFESVNVPSGYKLVKEQDVSADNGEIALYATEQLKKTTKLVVEDDPIDTASAKFQKIDNTVFQNGSSPKEVLPLNDATYHMYLLEEDGTELLQYFLEKSDGTYELKGSIGTSAYKPDLVSQKVSGKDGIISVTGLGYGTYVLEEVTAPVSYQLNKKKTYIYVMTSTIEENNGNPYVKFADEITGSETTTDTLLLKDDQVTSSIILSKADASNTDFYLGDAAYDFYRLKKNTNEAVTEADYLAAAQNASIASRGITDKGDFPNYWEKVSDKHYYTNSSGELTINHLPFGTYLLYEFLPPVGYKWNNDINKWETWQYVDGINTADEQYQQMIVIDKDTVAHNSTSTNVAVTDENGNAPNSADWTPTYQKIPTYHAFYAKHVDERKEGEARLIKRNKENFGLSDGIFALYQVNLTNAEIAGVLGKTETEVNAMSDADKQKALSKKELKVSDIDISNHFDAATGKPKTTASDVTIDTAIDQNMSTSGDVSTRGATKTISGLEWGIYYFYEVKAPSGYQKDKTPYVFAVNSDSVGTLIEIDVTDEKNYGEVWLYKQAKKASGANSDEHIKLFGAQFNLYTSNGNIVKSVPMLRYDKTKEQIPISKIDVISSTEIKITLKNGGTVTAAYLLDNNGTVQSVTADSTFISKYGNMNAGDFRVAYYVVSSDETKFYDPKLNRYRELVKTLGENPTEEEQAKYNEDANIIACITPTYITVDEGGRLNVRGLDWTSYYFRETVPPEGYGLADDVEFTVNAYNCENQFLPCEDPEAQAAIIIDKAIPDSSYFDAYGEPTFMFKMYGLEAFSQEDTDANRIPDYTKNSINYKKNGDEYTLSIHLSDPNTTGSAMINVPAGQYLIEEIPVSRYTCTNLGMISGTGGTSDKFKAVGITTPTSYKIYNDVTKYDINTTGANQWKAFCDLTGADSSEMLAFHVKYTNAIERYDNFSHVSYVDNRIPEREYITAFKPMYNALIPVYSGTDTSHEYEIDLAAALTKKDFEGILTYNTGKTVKLADLSKIQFSSSNNAPVTNVTWDSSTGTLKVTVANPSSLAGSSVNIDVGYSDVTPFTAYDTTNTNMVRGTLNLTFSEIKADKVKKLILKSDAANKSYFLETDNTTKDSSVSVIYTQDADVETTITKAMQNTAQTDTLTIMDGYEFSYWYLLDSDGRPVTDNKGDVIQFQRNADITKDEIIQYMFHGTFPAYLTADGKNLLPDTVTNPASVENINSFTFQAEVEENKLPKAMFVSGDEFRTYARCFAGNSNNSSVITKIIYSATSPTENGMTTYVLPSSIKGTNHKGTTDYTAVSLTVPGVNNGEPDIKNCNSYNADYPNIIYMWSVGTDVYWYSNDSSGNAMLNSNSSFMFAEMSGIQDNYASSGFEYMYAEEVLTMEKMFWDNRNTSYLKSLNINTWNTPKLTNMTSMFANNRALKTISWEKLDTQNVTTMANMLDCIAVDDINFLYGKKTDKLTNLNYFINPTNANNLKNQSLYPEMLSVLESWSNLDALTTSTNAFKDCWIRNRTFTTKNGATYSINGSGVITKVS